MLDFSFTPEQERLRQTLRAFALRELLPQYARWDRERAYPKEQVKKICVNRAFIGLKCLGAAQQTLDETITYVKTREQFGKPISRFQGVAFPLAEAATLIEAARWLCYKILWKRERGEPCTAEGAMVKWWVPKISAEIIHECLLLHGHYGYTQELPIEQRLRDVLGWQIGDGTPQIQKLIISRQLLGRDFAPET